MSKEFKNDIVIRFNTSCGSSNMGDYIINESASRELEDIFDNNFVVEYPTHTPVIAFYQNFKKNLLIRNCRRAKYKFLCGTNILAKSMFRPWPNWNVNIFNYAPYKGTILVGCGLGGKFEKVGPYTKLLYKKILSKEYIHSVRDEKAKKFLENMGYEVINTGCATLWQLTKEHCKEIPHKKSDSVIFTLTDYCRDQEKDKKLIEILRKNYKKIYFWVQGSEDYEYLKEFGDISDINLIYGLDGYKKLLEKGNIDFVGTRLHAGICAMQHKIRSIILIVDNRARDMKETYNLVALERDNIGQLDKMINSSFATDVNIDEQKINKWKSQFK